MLDKYIGDAIVAVFGAPLPSPDHAKDACDAAVEMIQTLETMRKKGEPPWDTLDIGVGINTGEATVGNMGSDYLFDYTAIGDVVNLASRLEGLNKFYRTHILVSEATYRRTGDGIPVRELDELGVKGRRGNVKVYQVLAEEGIREKVEQSAPVFESALDAYREGDWDRAISRFEEALGIEGSGPCRMFLERCRYLKQNPPEGEWDGSWRMDEK
jgi:adenylate cyclase